MSQAKITKSEITMQNPFAPYRTSHLHSISGSLYDSKAFVAGTTIPSFMTMFQEPMGSSGKTILDTNMQMSSKLPVPEMFEIRGIDLVFSQLSAFEDVFAFTENSLLELIIADKFYVREHIATMQQLSSSNASIWVCEYCKSLHIDFTCPKCGASEKTQFIESSTENVSGDRARTIDLSRYPVVLPSDFFFQVRITLNLYSLTLLPYSKEGTGLKFWVRLKGTHGRATQ